MLVVLFALKWLVGRDEALAEAAHPVQCCFIGLAGVATMLVAGGLLPYARGAALALFAVGAVFTVAFAAWRTGGLWRGERDEAATTPVLYLPSVAGCFVTATIAAALGYADWGQLAFGAGLFSWLAIESVLVRRLYNATSLAGALRPTMGVQLAPPAVGAVAYISVMPGPPDLMAHALIGYGLLQALILLRMVAVDPGGRVLAGVLGVHLRRHRAGHRAAAPDAEGRRRGSGDARAVSLRGGEPAGRRGGGGHAVAGGAGPPGDQDGAAAARCALTSDADIAGAAACREQPVRIEEPLDGGGVHGARGGIEVAGRLRLRIEMPELVAAARQGAVTRAPALTRRQWVGM